MKKLLIFVATLLVALPLFVQAATLGVYFDTDGTNNFLVTDDVFVEAYAIVFAEDFIGGTAFMIDMAPHYSLLSTTYPDGLPIGDPLTGVEIGLSDYAMGWGGTPVLFATFTLMQVNAGEVTQLNVVPHPNYDSVVYADHIGNQNLADGIGATISAVVANDDTSFGAVKNLYR